MKTTHVHALYVHGASRVHALEAHVKVAAMLLFVLAVVATPREAFWAFGTQAVLLIGAVTVARIPVGFLLRRLLVLIPFVLFAFLLPFFGGGARASKLSAYRFPQRVYGGPGPFSPRRRSA